MLRKLILGLLPVALISYGGWWLMKNQNTKPQKLHVKTADEESETDEESRKAFFVKERLRYEFDMLKDPVTGKIPKGIYKAALQQAERIPIRQADPGQFGMFVNNNYIQAGPNNVGGRTRAIAFDKRFGTAGNQVIIAGSVSGGLFRSTDGGTNWTRVTPTGELHNVTALAQDTRTGFENTWYAAGGEALGNTASGTGAFYLGFGILKSTDNGVTWSRLTLDVTGVTPPPGGFTLEAFDNSFDIVHKLIVNPTNGHLYICGHRRVIRSTDGGASFQLIFNGRSPSTADAGQMDLVCTNTGKLYLGVNGGFPNIAQRGLWSSTTGNAGSWVRFAGGPGGAADSIANWRGNSYDVLSATATDTSYISKRIVLALAPSNQNILYVTYENGLSQESAGGANPELDMYKFDFGASTFTNLSANMPDFNGQLNTIDPIASQGGYNILLAVKPDNANVVFLGGTNLYRSTDGFATSNNTSWIGGYEWWGATGTPGISFYDNSHPDMHALIFDPTNANRAICANDGGLQVANDISATVTAINPVSWANLNNYPTLQYYHVTLDNFSGAMNFMGGAQDNGTYLRQAASTVPDNYDRVNSGDGGAAFIGALGSGTARVFTSSQLGSILRQTTAAATNIRPTIDITANPGGGHGEFVTYFKGDFDNPEDLYYVNYNKVFRTTSASTVTGSTWSFMSGIASTNIAIRSLEVSRGPYISAHVLYIGTTNGKVFRLNDPRNVAATTAPVDITPSGLAGTVSDIAVNPNNDEEVMITVSNYNTISVYWTKNAKAAAPTWFNAEGNITLPSFRSCMIVVKKDGSNNSVKEYYIGTSTGLYSATNIGTTLEAGGSITWTREGSTSLNFAVIQSMDYRPQDNILLLGTHGNGMYYANLGTPDFQPNQSTGINDPVRNDKNFISKVFPTVANTTIDYRIGNMFTIQRVVLQVYNTGGQLLLKKETGYQNGSLDVSRLSKGAYILTITSSDYKQQFIQQFVKE
jgi:hypothetical protein